MSLLWMVKALSTKVKNASRKLVLVKLSDNANDEGICWPSIQHIADQCEMSTRTVQRHLKDLQKAGFLRIEERRSNNFVNQSNLYTLLFSEGQEFQPEKSGESPIAPEAASGEGDNLTPYVEEGDNLSPPPVTESPPQGDTVSPRTCHSLEPPNEPSSTGACASEIFTQGDDSREKFPMHENWQPGEQFHRLCRIRGLVLEGCDGQRLVDEVRDFVCYWVARSDSVQTQSLWENKLAQHLLRAKRQGKLSSEVSHAVRSGHFAKPKTSAELHAESCSGAFDNRSGQHEQAVGDEWSAGGGYIDSTAETRPF